VEEVSKAGVVKETGSNSEAETEDGVLNASELGLLSADKSCGEFTNDGGEVTFFLFAEGFSLGRPWFGFDKVISRFELSVGRRELLAANITGSRSEVLSFSYSSARTSMPFTAVSQGIVDCLKILTLLKKNSF
jgi:hypothetical protein